MVGEDGSEALLFMRKGLADRVLHEGVAGCHNPLFCQVMHEFPEDIDGFCGHRCCLPGLCR
jgi:hypothetical protein